MSLSVSHKVGFADYKYVALSLLVITNNKEVISDKRITYIHNARKALKNEQITGDHYCKKHLYNWDVVNKDNHLWNKFA